MVQSEYPSSKYDYTIVSFDANEAVVESTTAVVAASDAVRLFEGATVKVAERYAVRLFNSTVGENIANRYVACIFYHSVLLDVTDGYVA